MTTNTESSSAWNKVFFRARLIECVCDQQQRPFADFQIHLGQNALVSEDSHMLDLSKRQLGQRSPSVDSAPQPLVPKPCFRDSPQPGRGAAFASIDTPHGVIVQPYLQAEHL